MNGETQVERKIKTRNEYLGMCPVSPLIVCLATHLGWKLKSDNKQSKVSSFQETFGDEGLKKRVRETAPVWISVIHNLHLVALAESHVSKLAALVGVQRHHHPALEHARGSHHSPSPRHPHHRVGGGGSAATRYLASKPIFLVRGSVLWASGATSLPIALPPDTVCSPRRLRPMNGELKVGPMAITEKGKF